jgi:hypothetical protein
LLLPFRNQPPAPRLGPGYHLLSEGEPSLDALNVLGQLNGERPRDPSIWKRVLERSLWHLRVETDAGDIVGFVRATSDRALNANLWDLWGNPQDPARNDVTLTLVRTALQRLRRELPGCSISLSAPPEAHAALEQCGFLVDPGGIRAMGLSL